MTSTVSAISARGHGHDGFLDELLEAAQRSEGGAGMQGADAAGMAGAPGLQEVQGLGAAHLADRDAIGPQAQRRSHEIGKRGGAVLGAERHQVRRGALQFAGVLDQHDPVAGLGDLRQERVDQRRLAGRGAAGDEDIAALANRTAQQIRLAPTT